MFQRSIRRGKQSLLQMRTATTESVSLFMLMKRFGPKKQEFAFRMTPDQSIGRACQPQADAGPFGVNAAPECIERLRFPMVILNRLARVPRTCIQNAITSVAKAADHALLTPELSKPLLPS